MENRKINEYDLLKIICVILVVIGHVLNLYHSGGAIVVKDEPSFLPIRDFIYIFICQFLWLYLGLFMKSRNQKASIKTM